MRKIRWWRQILTQLVLIVIALYVILPIWGVARLAFDGSLISRPTEFRLLPKEFSVNSFFEVLDKPYQSVSFLTLFKNSMVVSACAALLAFVFGASLAYALARYRFPGRKPILFILLLTAVIPPIAFTIPLYVFLSLLKIRTTLLALILVYAVFALPFCIWNIRAAFQAVPKELEEAAYLDGAGEFATFWQVSLPIALPSISVAALISFLMAYSEFAIGWFFVEKAKTVTLAMSIYAMVQSGNAQPWSVLGSLVIIMSIPVVIVFLVLQNTLLEKMMFSSGGN
jgi:arabinogalactan oligomer/maltooligosaccharide transport system permease protein